MPRFFFHTEDGATFPDQDGTELHDLAAAKTAALKTLGEILRDDPDIFWAHQSFHLTCSDSDGVPYFRIDLSADFSPANHLKAV
jgi:hypothetical protein